MTKKFFILRNYEFCYEFITSYMHYVSQKWNYLSVRRKSIFVSSEACVYNRKQINFTIKNIEKNKYIGKKTVVYVWQLHIELQLKILKVKVIMICRGHDSFKMTRKYRCKDFPLVHNMLGLYFFHTIINFWCIHINLGKNKDFESHQ